MNTLNTNQVYMYVYVRDEVCYLLIIFFLFVCDLKVGFLSEEFSGN